LSSPNNEQGDQPLPVRQAFLSQCLTSSQEDSRENKPGIR